MKIAEFLDVSVDRLQAMTTAELRAYVRGGANIANQRINRLKAAEMTSSPAFQALPAKAKKVGFVPGKMSRQQLLNAAQAEQRFIRGRTSTVTGWKTEMKTTTAKLNKAIQPKAKIGFDLRGNPVPISKANRSETLTVKQNELRWNIMSKLKEANVIGEKGSYSADRVNQIIIDSIKANPNIRKLTDTKGRDTESGGRLLDEIIGQIEDDYESHEADIQANRADIFSRGQGKKL